MKRLLVLVLMVAGCTPPAVRVVDGWLTGYEAGDIDRVVENTWVGDRELVERCLRAQQMAATSSLALALPPLPISHEITEIEKKPSPTRHVVLTKITMKNPLPYEAERVGQDLGDFPKTRSQRRRFLAVEDGGVWGVKLDLARVLVRADFVDKFTLRLRDGKREDAARMLDAVPPPPDEANVQKKKDRLVETLRAALDKAEKRATKTSTTTR